MQTTVYDLIGCVPGCQHRLPDTREIKTNKHPVTGTTYEVLYITPHCQRMAECAARRAEIYQRAQSASDAASDRCTTMRGKVAARERAWRKVADEYTQRACPFFAPLES